MLHMPPVSDLIVYLNFTCIIPPQVVSVSVPVFFFFLVLVSPLRFPFRVDRHKECVTKALLCSGL